MTEQNAKTVLVLGNQEIEQFREYLQRREYADATSGKYLADIRAFFSYLNGATHIGKEELIAYKEWLQKCYAPASVNSRLASLNQYLIYRGAPELRLKSLRLQKSLFSAADKSLTREEYRRLLAGARKEGKSELALLMETLCSTGIRVSELAFFTLSAVRRGKIEVCNKGKIRVILLPDALQKKLLYYAHRKGVKQGALFVTRNGRVKDRSNIWAEMKALHKSTGIAQEKIFPHNLRHLFAQTYYGMTHDISGLADLLGHNSLDTTRIYMALPCEVYQKRLNKMGLVIGNIDAYCIGNTT